MFVLVLFGSIFLIIWYSMCFLCFLVYRKSHKNMKYCTARTSGIIIEIKDVIAKTLMLGGESDTMGSYQKVMYHYPTVLYRDDSGNKHTVSPNTGTNEVMHIGDVCSVRYNPDNPDMAYIVRRDLFLTVGIILSIIPFVMAAVFYVLYNIIYI